MNPTLPTYQIRISKRAKYARLSIKPNGVLEVVLPEGMNPNQAEGVVRDHHDWILKHQQKINVEQAINPPIGMRPSSIDFPLLKQTIPVTYSESDKNAYQENDSGLTILYHCDDMIVKVLQYWLKCRAERCLSSVLFSIAQDMDETYQSVSIRLQKTRWGSCSSQRRINLNAKLLLLPETLIRYVMVHELAHLQHLNHSKAFWQRVAQFEPDYLEQRKTLREWEKQEPCWVL